MLVGKREGQRAEKQKEVSRRRARQKLNLALDGIHALELANKKLEDDLDAMEEDRDERQQQVNRLNLEKGDLGDALGRTNERIRELEMQLAESAAKAAGLETEVTTLQDAHKENLKEVCVLRASIPGLQNVWKVRFDGSLTCDFMMRMESDLILILIASLMGNEWLPESGMAKFPHMDVAREATDGDGCYQVSIANEKVIEAMMDSGMFTIDG